MSWLSSEEQMCCILAAFAHDLRHPGLNQAFLLKTRHHLAELYDGQSVLENFHWDCTKSILQETKLFDHFDALTWSERCGGNLNVQVTRGRTDESDHTGDRHAAAGRLPL